MVGGGMAAEMEGCRGDRSWTCRVMAGGARINLVVAVVMLLFASDALADGNVTMDSIVIYNTHEWFGLEPTVYFQCHEEKKVYLPDVLKKNEQYVFMGQESWQPLTTLYGEKCKRCGIYEEDEVKADDTFYEWELCPKDFTASLDGRHVIFQDKEFNVSLLCPDCIPQSTEGDGTGMGNSPGHGDEEENEGRGAGFAFVIVILVFLVLCGLGVVAYTKWRQKQRAEQQARFVKMFEDHDDLDAELGLKDDL